MNKHEEINYLELQSSDLEAAKAFFSTVFGWNFVDYGPDYCSFADAGIDGGIVKSDKISSTENGSVLIVFYSGNLEHTLANIEDAGGSVIKPIFSFPGGRRFHFCDPTGNEFAVWSDKEAL